MTIQLYANNASTTIAAPINSSQTSISVAPSTGDLFPSPTSGQSFRVTLNSVSDPAVYEICACTNRTGDVLTVTRGLEGTTGTPFVIGDLIANFDTAGVMDDLVQSTQLQNGYYSYAVATGTGNALAASIPSNLTVLPDGFTCTIRSVAANTGAATLQLTLGSTLLATTPITQNGNLPLTGGEITGSGYPVILTYSTAYGSFVMQNPYVSEFGLVNIDQIQSQNYTYGVCTGGSSAIIVTVATGLTSLIDGAIVCFRAQLSNGATPATLQVRYGSVHLTAKPLYKNAGATLIAQNLSPSDIIAGSMYLAVYSSSNDAWILLNPTTTLNPLPVIDGGTGVKNIVGTSGYSGIGIVQYDPSAGYAGSGGLTTISPYPAGRVLTSTGASGWIPISQPAPKILYQAQISTNTLYSIPAYTDIGTGADLVGRPIQVMIGGFAYEGGLATLSLSMLWGLNALTNSTTVFSGTVNFQASAAGTIMPYVTPVTPFSNVLVQVNTVGSARWAWLTITSY